MSGGYWEAGRPGTQQTRRWSRIWLAPAPAVVAQARQKQTSSENTNTVYLALDMKRVIIFPLTILQ